MTYEMEEIIKKHTGKDDTLDSYEIRVFRFENYTFDSSTPPAFKKSIELIYYSFRTNPNSIDFNDPYILGAFKNVDNESIRGLYDMFNYMNSQGMDVSSLPNGNLFIKSIEGARRIPFGPPPTFKMGMIARCDSNIEGSWNNIHDAQLSIRNDFISMSNIEKNNLFETIISENIPITVVPHEVLSDPRFLNMYCASRNMDDSQKDILVHILSTQDYTPELEASLASILGYESVDELISHNIINNPIYQNVDKLYRSRDMSDDIIYLAAIKLRAIRTLRENGVTDIPFYLNVAINENESGNITAQFDPVRKRTYTVYSPKSTLFDTQRDARHECEHAIQYHNVKNCNIKKDPDIDFYAMDKVIRLIANKDRVTYYRDNNISLYDEFDADYKAHIDTYSLEQKGSTSTSLIEDLKNEIRERRDRSKTILDHIASTVPYKLDRFRRYAGKSGDIEEIFVFAIEKCMSNPNLNWEEIKSRIDNEFPILNYKYNFEGGRVHKLTPFELVERLENATDEKEIEIYVGLIRNSISPRKDLECQKNIEAYTRLLNNSSLPLDIKNQLREVLSTPESDKYKEFLETSLSTERKC